MRELARSFGSREVIHSLSIEMEAGGRVALRGPNGSGKSTALRCITGTLSPSAGEVAIGGHRAGTTQARRLVGASLSQERSFYLRLSGHENLLLFARLRRGRIRAAAREVRAIEDELELGQIAAQRTDRYSTGMMQQLGFARALLGGPSVLVLDEPTRSLDQDAIARLWSAIDRRPEVCVLLATHRQDDVARCSRVIDFPC